MYYVYILFSEGIGEYYCGQCNNVADRLRRHNSGETQSIRHGRPWKLTGYLEVSTRSLAMQTEKRIKKRGIKRWLQEHSHELIIS
ncbi:MAG: GIY-YIG nuclease family protein [Chitinophagales bacterium]|nr:GIY-YIG nuclease family protein [Chitinophagales bacterium]